MVITVAEDAYAYRMRATDHRKWERETRRVREGRIERPDPESGGE